MYGITRVLIDEAVAGTEPAMRAEKLFAGAVTRYKGEEGFRVQGSEFRVEDEERGDPKTTLIITENRGEFLKPCPCTPEYTGCGYHVLNYMHGCPLTCTYCVLQAYLNAPGIKLLANWDDIEKELVQKAFTPKRQWRIGTGELGDSLALEPVCGFAGRLVELFGRHEGPVLELKTKTVDIDGLLKLPHRGRTVLAWSVNAPAVIAGEERHTASLEERARAARRALDAGFRVAFHCDPALEFPGWEAGYDVMIETLAAHVGGSKGVAWFSIGGMRFMPALQNVIERDHPASRVAAGEFITGLDGKHRYYRPVRSSLFKRIHAAATRAFPSAAVYLCMENREVWQAATGAYPGPAGVSRMLDAAVFT